MLFGFCCDMNKIKFDTLKQEHESRADNVLVLLKYYMMLSV